MARNQSEKLPAGPQWLRDNLAANRALKTLVESHGLSFSTCKLDISIPAIQAACVAVRDIETSEVDAFFDFHPSNPNTWQDHLDCLEREAKNYAAQSK